MVEGDSCNLANCLGYNSHLGHRCLDTDIGSPMTKLSIIDCSSACDLDSQCTVINWYTGHADECKIKEGENIDGTCYSNVVDNKHSYYEKN